MERKSSIKDVHKVIQKDLTELYKTLNNKLGIDNPFAKFSIGGGFYLWSDIRCQWYQMISVDDFEQDIVRNALFQTKNDVAAKLGEKTAEMLFTTPDDSYIYYNDVNGQIRILVAGWGFNKPVRISGSGDVDELSKKDPITLSFSCDGDKLQNYEFGIQLPKQVKRLRTDNAGLYKFSNLKVGDRFTIKDLRTNKDFILCVAEGQSHYDYDVTVYSTLSLKAEQGNQPIAGEEANITYNGKDYHVVTDVNGVASIKLPIHEGVSINAILREQTKSDVINADGNKMVFSFEKPTEESEIDIEVSVIENSHSVANASVDIEYNGNNYTGTTNGNGIFTQHVFVVEGKSCMASVTGFESQSKELKKDRVNVFRFEKTTVMSPEPPIPPTPHNIPVFFTPYIRIEGDNGFIGSKYPISVECDGVLTEYVSDENGIAQLPEMEEGKNMKVIDGLNPDNTAEYELRSDQLEYVFHVPYEPKEDERDIKVMFRDYEGKPIKCDRIRFQQDNNCERLATLDEDGNTFFAKDTFKMGESITATIMGGNRDFESITFTLDENEYEYLLQEKHTKSSWWKILQQVLAILVTIVALWFLWSAFTGFCSGMFDIIYH